MQSQQSYVSWSLLSILKNTVWSLQLYQALMQKSQRSKIQYCQDRVCYQIDWSKQTHIMIKIDDMRNRKQMLVVVTNQILKEYSITTDTLATEILKQWLYESQKKRHLLKFEGNTVTLSFNYPKCQIRKSLHFEVEWKDDAQESDRKSSARFRQLQQVMKSNNKSPLKKLQAHMGKVLRQMDIKLLVMDQQLNTMKNEVIEFEQRYDYLINFFQSESKLCMQQQRQNLIDSNLRYFDQFTVIAGKLQTSLESTRQLTDIEFKRFEELMDKDRRRVEESFDGKFDERFEMKFDGVFEGRFDGRMDEKFDVKFDKSFNEMFDQRSSKLIEELSQLKVFKENVRETFGQLRSQIAEIESKQQRQSKDSFSVGGTLTTSICLSPKNSLFKTFEKQDSFQTPIREDYNERSSCLEKVERKQEPSPFDSM